MKFAAISIDEQILPVLRAQQTLGQFEITDLWAPTTSLQGEMQELIPTAVLHSSWDELLTRTHADGIILSGTNETAIDVARQAMQLGKSLVIVISPKDDATRIFDYTATWQEAPDRVVPLLTSGMECAVEHIRRQFEQGDFGKLWKVEFARTVEVAGDEAILTDIAQRWLLQDCAWLRHLDAEIKSVSMTATGPGPDKLVEVAVRLTRDEGVDLNWKLLSGDQPTWKLTLFGESGTLTVEHTGDGRWIAEPSIDLTADGVATDPLHQDLEHQLAAIARGAPVRSWGDLIQLGEIGATAARSFVKKRTLPIHFEESSERSQFKSQMAAIGCGVLLWTMFGVIGLLTLASMFDPRDKEYLLSASADFVLESTEFASGSEKLTKLGEEHFQRITKRWSASTPVVLIETEGDPKAELNESRRQSIVAKLNELKIRSPEQRVVVRIFQGQWFETAMVIGWVIVFFPLGVILIAQLLIVVSRPIETSVH